MREARFSFAPQPRLLPMCPHCKQRMPLVRLARSPHYLNVRVWTHWCECGEVVEQAVADHESDLAA